MCRYCLCVVYFRSITSLILIEAYSRLTPVIASYKSNPSSIPRGTVDSYSTLGHVGGGKSCEGYTLMGVATTHTG